MQVLKIKLYLILLLIVDISLSATLSPGPDVPDNFRLLLNLSSTTTPTEINGTTHKILDLEALTLYKNGNGIIQNSEKILDAFLAKEDDHLYNATRTQTEKPLQSSDEELFSSMLPNDYVNLTTESWEFDNLDWQNTSVEEIFKTPEKTLDVQTNDILSSDQIIKKWMFEETQSQNVNESLETQIKDVKVNGLFVVENSTALIGVDVQNSGADYNSSVRTEAYAGTIDGVTVTIPYTISWTRKPTLHSKINANSEYSTILTDSITSSANEYQDSSMNKDDDMSEDAPIIPNVIGTLRNKNEIPCVSLNCSIQIYINNTPIAMPLNLSIIESFDSEHGYITFKWFNNNNDNITIGFIIHPKGEYYYIDSCALIIKHEDVSDTEIFLEKTNLQLFRTKIGTTLKVDNGVIVPMGQGIVMYLSKVRFSVLENLFNFSKFSSSSDNFISEYFLEILCSAVGFVLLSIVTMFICKRYIPTLVQKKT